MEITAPYQTVAFDAVPDVSILEVQLQCISGSFNNFIQLFIACFNYGFFFKIRKRVDDKNISDSYRVFAQQFNAYKAKTCLTIG